MAHRRSHGRFILTNIVVWLLMTVILVVVPDTLEQWTSLEISRVIGWALGYAVWVIAVEQGWRERIGPLLRFVLQLVLWVSSALLAMWISEAARLTLG
jgi:hypothetical protein